MNRIEVYFLHLYFFAFIFYILITNPVGKSRFSLLFAFSPPRRLRPCSPRFDAAGCYFNDEEDPTQPSPCQGEGYEVAKVEQNYPIKKTTVVSLLGGGFL
jgi:hypothetical protein